ncbi:MAG: SulP family inorganic anion transporter [Acidobacteria bacterium]|nr:SulP family inorganic anion transporter [Acidobacteriota bacterium]MBI3422100.1 SulP family inorganic anion transporter [Acidobacteriota bacterium]
MTKQAANCTGRALEEPIIVSATQRAPQIRQYFQRRFNSAVSALTTSWRGDFFGGTIAALIAVPYGMALAIAIGLPPEAGLYTSIIGGFISGMLSDAPIVVGGLSATVVPVLASLVKTHGIGAALAAGALSGVLMVLIGVLRLGRFFRYLPQSVVAGFTSGLGLVIVSSQLKVVFGVKPQPVSFDLGIIDDCWAVLRVATHSDPHALSITALVIGAMFLLPLWKPNFPASLVAVVGASLAAKLSGWALPLVGALPDSFPHPSLNALDFSAFSALLHPAFALAGLITINQLLTVVVTDRLQEASGEVRFNRELVAQGLANVVSPFFGAPPGVAMLARTVASHRAGAVTRWSVLAHSGVLLLFLLPLRNLISQIPLVVLAAVTVAVGLQLVGWERFRALRKTDRLDAVLFLLTFGLVIISDLIVGVGVGSILAMLFFVERAAQSTQLQAVMPQSEPPAVSTGDTGALTACLQSEMQMYRLTGPLFFASSEKVLKRLLREVTAQTLVLDLTEARPIDSEAAACLKQLAQRQRERGGELHLIGLDQTLRAAFDQPDLLAAVGTIVYSDARPDAAPLSTLVSTPMALPTAAPRASASA